VCRKPLLPRQGPWHTHSPSEATSRDQRAALGKTLARPTVFPGPRHSIETATIDVSGPGLSTYPTNVKARLLRWAMLVIVLTSSSCRDLRTPESDHERVRSAEDVSRRSWYRSPQI